MRLQSIDDLSRRDHWYLTADDRCYYFGEYTARGGFSCSETNGLISNLKKPMDRQGRPEWAWKGHAIRRAGELFRSAIRDDQLPMLTFVPVPPSKCKEDAEYDDRIVQMLMHMSAHADIRQIVAQTVSTPKAHESETRPTPQDLTAIYQIDESLLPRPVRTIVIVDDVLTTGCHLRAMQLVLCARFPGVPIFSMFIARRSLNADSV
jgi:predicted amidophosphoribosyltransferase